MRVGVAIAVAIHVAIIAALIATQRAANYTAGYDSIEGSSTGATLGGRVVKSNWNLLTLTIVNEAGEALDSVRVHEMLGDSIKVTPRGGTATFGVRAGAMFLVRITKRGYEPLTTRLPNNVPGSSTRTIRLRRSPRR
jgi:hypothetical protein